MTHTYQNQLELVPKYPEVHYEPVQNILEFANEQYRRIWTTCSPAHQKENLHKIGRFCEFADYATRPITSYRPTHIYAFLEHREETYGNKDGTLNRYIAALSKVFHHYDDEYNTVTAPRIKWRKENGNRPRFFTATEITRLQEILSSSEYPWAAHIVTIALQTGMRKGEILSIGLGKNDVKKNVVYGEISEGRDLIHLKSTKNGSDRRVQLHSEAIKALEALSWKPSVQFDHHQFYRVWDRARRRIAPNDDTFVFHVCRHTAATRLASLGFNTKKIGLLLGHKTIVTTAKYIHDDDDTQLQMINALDYK